MILSKGVLEHDGLERNYVLLAPKELDSQASYPLVLALHGGGGDGEQMCSLKGGIQELAAQEVFIVVCPSGVEKHWNDGRDIDRWRAHREDINDVGFLRDLISRVIVDNPVDSERVFVTGMSNGGKMSLRLACEAEDIFRAAAPVIASLPADMICNPSEPISVLIMNGTEDPLVLWDGGEVKVLYRALGEAVSTPDTVAFWVNHNRCHLTPVHYLLPDEITVDNSSVQVDRYGNCAEGVKVELYTVSGGGHTWPGGPQYLPEFLIGPTNQDIHAGQAIWNFFAATSQ